MSDTIPVIKIVNVKKQSSCSKVVYICLTMAVHLSGEEFETIRDLFKILDEDGDGKITVTEFRNQLIERKKLKENEKDVEDYIEFLLRIYDMDGNGSLEFPEFLQILAFISYDVTPTTDYIKQLFKALDKESKGFLSVDDIKRFCRIFKTCDGVPYEESKADNLIKKLDINGDGEINYSEFMINYFQFKQFEDGK